jgi:hypothetical protein
MLHCCPPLSEFPHWRHDRARHLECPLCKCFHLQTPHSTVRAAQVYANACIWCIDFFVACVRCFLETAKRRACSIHDGTILICCHRVQSAHTRELKIFGDLLMRLQIGDCRGCQDACILLVCVLVPLAQHLCLFVSLHLLISQPCSIAVLCSVA